MGVYHAILSAYVCLKTWSSLPATQKVKHIYAHTQAQIFKPSRHSLNSRHYSDRSLPILSALCAMIARYKIVFIFLILYTVCSRGWEHVSLLCILVKWLSISLCNSLKSLDVYLISLHQIVYVPNKHDLSS